MELDPLHRGSSKRGLDPLATTTEPTFGVSATPASPSGIHASLAYVKPARVGDLVFTGEEAVAAAPRATGVVKGEPSEMYCRWLGISCLGGAGGTYVFRYLHHGICTVLFFSSTILCQ